MLKGIGLTKATRKRAILDGVTFEIPIGTTASVLGPSGSGKTTLLRTIMGLDRPDAGELYLEDQCLTRNGLHIAAEKRDISLVFQEFTLFPNLNVSENMAFGLKQPKAAQARVNDLLELLEIGHLKNRRIDKLSGGEQQRVALARALAVRPRVLLLDEPFSNIDSMLRERLYARLRTRLVEDGTTTLIATHDHKEAFYFSDSILVLNDGLLMDQKPPRLIYEQPANAWVAEFFGETNFLSGSQLEELNPGCNFSRGSCYLVRPEAFNIASADDGAANATVKTVVYYGAYQDVHVSFKNNINLRARGMGPHLLSEGERIRISLRDDAIPHALPDPLQNTPVLDEREQQGEAAT